MKKKFVNINHGVWVWAREITTMTNGTYTFIKRADPGEYFKEKTDIEAITSQFYV